jgi:hypothetical protein
MFPWIFGFEWTPGHIIFLGVFYTVAVIVATTVVTALARGARDVRRKRVEAIAWHGDFEDLPSSERRCRHAFTGEMPASRVCPNAFDCCECEQHPHVVKAHPAHQIATIVDDSLGLAVPLDRYYHRGHTWVRPESDGTLTVGPDELARRVAARPDRIELPAVGTRVRRNGIGWRMWIYGTEFRVLSPVDGEVVETGGAGEWRLRIKPDANVNLAHLLRGAEAVRWFGRELDRVQLLASTADAAVPALADGGVPVDDFAEACPKADWRSACGAMFLEN